MSAVRRMPTPLLLGSLLLTSAWALTVPIFEAPDEPAHWQFARYLHDYRRLPVYGPDFVEANSPPLYYMLIAPLARASEEPPPLLFYDAEGHLNLPAPPRFFQNSADDLQRYWRIRAARLVTVLLAPLTVWFCFLAGAEATGRSTTGLFAGGLVAFLPQFTFRGSTISNDPLVTLFCAVAVYLTVRLIRCGFTWTRGLKSAAVIAAAFLSKISAVFLPLPLSLAILTESGAPVGLRLRRLSVLVLALVLVAPWTIRNQLLYGDPFASGAMEVAVAPIIVKKSIWSPYFLETFPSVLGRSFVGMFGWMNVLLPDFIYSLFGTLAVVAALGCAVALRRGDVNRRLLLILATFPILNLLIVVHINLTFSQPQGRYLFPALPALAVLAAIGLESAIPWARRRAAALVIGFATFNLVILALDVVPAYWPSPIRTISTARTTLRGTPDRDGASAPVGEGFRLGGAAPALIFETDVDAEEHNFLQFDIEGTGAGAIRLGGIYFSGGEGASGAGYRIPFTWRDNGARQNTIVPLFPHPAWRGRIRTLRINPVETSVEGGPQMSFWIGNVLLRGRLDQLPASVASIGPPRSDRADKKRSAVRTGPSKPGADR